MEKLVNKKIYALIVAGGSGSRVNGSLPKQYLQLDDHTILEHTIEKFKNHPLISDILVVIAHDHEKIFNNIFNKKISYIFGGKERKDSVRLGLQNLADKNPDYILVHDAARPFVTENTITEIIQAIDEFGAATAACKVVDTIKEVEDSKIIKTIPRENLYHVQTPQGFHYQKILELHNTYQNIYFTDDCQLYEKANLLVRIVETSKENFKITTENDFLLAQKLIRKMKIKVGIGFDAHKFKTESADSFIMLCGIKVPCKYSIIAHSDGDLALHALTDAMLGTIGDGDIGKHFPPSEPQWKNADSKIFIEHAHKLIKQKNGTINNVDIIIIGQEPKISPHNENLRKSLSEMLKLPLEDISVKATTTEKMGFTGREEGIACQALVTVAFA